MTESGREFDVPYNAEEFNALVNRAVELRKKRNEKGMRSVVVSILKHEERLRNRPEAWTRTLKAICTVLGRRGARKSKGSSIAKQEAEIIKEMVTIPDYRRVQNTVPKPITSPLASMPNKKDITPFLPGMEDAGKPLNTYRH